MAKSDVTWTPCRLISADGKRTFDCARSSDGKVSLRSTGTTLVGFLRSLGWKLKLAESVPSTEGRVDLD